MQVHDLTGQFIELIRGEIDRQRYLDSHPRLFEHYFTNWSAEDLPFAELTEDDVQAKATRIKTRLPEVEAQFEKAGFDLSDLPVILFVGHNTSNGHAALFGDTYHVWLPVETYTSDLLVDIFVTHEIAHALHYRLTSGFYLQSLQERHHIGRQLLSEGVATYMTKQVRGVSDRASLWADYLSEEDCQRWLKDCREQTPALCKLLLERFDDSETNFGLFVAADPDDVFFYRAGYWVGLKIIEDIAKRRSLALRQLLSFDREQFSKEARRILDESTKNPAILYQT
jgi:hypothetical protein